jgi:hypothetical protein
MSLLTGVAGLGLKIGCNRDAIAEWRMLSTVGFNSLRHGSAGSRTSESIYPAAELAQKLTLRKFFEQCSTTLVTSVGPPGCDGTEKAWAILKQFSHGKNVPAGMADEKQRL